MALHVGVTGGIGSGKSTVCKIFEVLGIPVYNADNEAKKMYTTDAELKEQIIQSFGNIVYPGGHFDKQVLRDIVFRDDEKLTLLNILVHPKVLLHAENWMNNQTAPYVIKEAALMIESGSNKKLDKLIVVTCPIDIRIKRVKDRDGLQEQEVRDRIEMQLPEEELRLHADFEIVNDGAQALISQVMKIHAQLIGVN